MQFAAVVGVDHFPFGKDINARDTGFAVAVAGATIATEGELDFGTRRAGIDIEDTGGDIAHGTLQAIDILGIDCARQAKFAVVVDSDGLFKRSHFNDRERRAEDLLLSQAHVWSHIGKERGMIEVPPRKLALSGD